MLSEFEILIKTKEAYDPKARTLRSRLYKGKIASKTICQQATRILATKLDKGLIEVNERQRQ